jgi:hypothetical protein
MAIPLKITGACLRRFLQQCKPPAGALSPPLLLWSLVVLLILIPASPSLFADSGSAGSGRWKRSDTDLFTFIYREGDRGSAGKLMAFSEEVYQRVSDYLDYRPKERIPVVVYGSTAIANGFFSPYPPNISIFVSSPTGPWLGASTESWLKTLFVHELIHYMHLTQPVGFFGRASRLFGPLTRAASIPFMPGWMVEGVTTYGESLLSAGGRGTNPFFEMQHIAPLLEERMYSYDQAGFSSPFAPSGRIYASGYLMVEHLLDEYGEDAFIRLNRSFQAAPFLGMRRALRKSTGSAVSDFYPEMLDKLYERYAHRRKLDSGEIISPHGHGDWFLPFPTEAGLVTYGSGFDRKPGLYLLPRGEEHSWRKLAEMELLDQWSYTVDAEAHIAVASLFRPNLSFRISDPGSSDLYIIPINREEAKPRQLTRGRRLFHPALSPDGTMLLALERQDSYSRLVKVDMETGRLDPLYSPRESSLFAPVFSPDGALLALVENRRGVQVLTILDRTGKELGSIDMEGAALYFPRFAPEKSYELWFGSDSGGALALYRSWIEPLPRGGLGYSEPQLVLQERVAAFSGFPLDDGKTVLYGSYHSWGYAVKKGLVEEPNGYLEAGPEEKRQILSGAGGGEGGSDLAGIASVAGGEGGAGGNDLAGVASVTGGEGGGGGNGTPSIRGALEAEKPYRDLPRPILWVPQLYFRGGSVESLQIDLGPLFIAAGNLGHQELSVSLLYNPSAMHPSGSFTWNIAPGATSWEVTGEHEYTLPGDEGGCGGTCQYTTLSLGAGRVLWYSVNPGVSRYATAAIRTSFRNSIGVPGEKSFLDTLEHQDLKVHRSLGLAAALQLGASGETALRDFFGAPGWDIASTFQIRPKILDTEELFWGNLSTLSMRVQPLGALPGLWGAPLLVPALACSFTSDSSAMGELPYLSGGFRDKILSGPSALLGRIELRVPLSVHDKAWRGIASTGIGISLYGEQGAVLSEKRPVLSDYTVAGTEISVQLFFNTLPFRLTGGAAFQLPHKSSGREPEYLFYGSISLQ